MSSPLVSRNNIDNNVDDKNSGADVLRKYTNNIIYPCIEDRLEYRLFCCLGLDLRRYTNKFMEW
jgi:hypothetical protein